MLASETTSVSTLPISLNAAQGKEATNSVGIPIRKAVKERARELEESCETGAIRDTLIAASWHRANLWLGLSATIIAAIAAFAAGKTEILDQFFKHFFSFSDLQSKELSRDIAALLAVTSSVLTSILTFLAPSERAGSYHAFSNKFRALRDKARSLIEFDCSQNKKEKALRENFERLMCEKSEIDASHPIVPNWVHDKAYVKLHKKLANKRAFREQREAENRTTHRAVGNMTASPGMPAKL